MKVESRKFNRIIKSFRPEDYHKTWETIRKFNFQADRQGTLDDGSEVLCSDSKRLKRFMRLQDGDLTA